MLIEVLSEKHMPHILSLQQHCVDRGDPFTPTSARGYALCFRFRNFILGVFNEQRDELAAFLSCSIPTSRASRNFGRGRIQDALLDQVGHMNTLLIRSEYRGRGIGKALMRAGIDELRKRGAPSIFAVVSPHNAISRNMVGSLGFSEIDAIELNGEPKVLYHLTA